MLKYKNKSLKKLGKMAVFNALFFRIFVSFTKNIPRIFVYHRFSLEKDPDGRKIDSDTFEWQLNKLRSDWHVIQLKDYLGILKDGKSLKKVVVITIDDGYCDFFDIAFPILKKFNLPATFFPTVEFVNRKIWLWPDRIDYILRRISGFR